MQPETAILTGASFATVGWVYTARRQRTLARKQHTITVILQANFNADFRSAMMIMATAQATPCPCDLAKNIELKEAFQLIMNHYEFIAAGLRNGDFDERLIRDSQRATMLTIYEWGKDFIWGLRTSRRRQSIYEHLEWLHKRWETKPPKWYQRFIEYCRGKPISGRRVNPFE